MENYSFLYDLIFLAPVLFGLVRGIGKGANTFGKIFEATWGAVKWALIVLVVVFIVSLIDSVFPFVPEEFKTKSFLYYHLIEWANDLLSLLRSKLG